MTKKQVSTTDQKAAKEHQKEGAAAYQAWDLDQAIHHLETATRLAPDEPDYLLDLARAVARAGDYDRALKALAGFMRLEPDSPLAERFEQLFASGMDDVEVHLTDKMTAADISLDVIGAAIQMWLEYRIALGREPLLMRKPEAWAAAVDYTVRKVNLRHASRKEVAALYGISDRTLKSRYEELIGKLDVMPCDYRYFTGEENPLDKLVEAAELLGKLEKSFLEP